MHSERYWACCPLAGVEDGSICLNVSGDMDFKQELLLNIEIIKVSKYKTNKTKYSYETA